MVKEIKNLFRPLTAEEKEELKGAFKEIAEDLRALRDHYRRKRREL